MAQLKTTFAGLTLSNPIIISSSGLTNSADKNKKLEAGRRRCHCSEISLRRANHDGGRSTHGDLWLSRRQMTTWAHMYAHMR